MPKACVPHDRRRPFGVAAVPQPARKCARRKSQEFRLLVSAIQPHRDAADQHTIAVADRLLDRLRQARGFGLIE